MYRFLILHRRHHAINSVSSTCAYAHKTWGRVQYSTHAVGEVALPLGVHPHPKASQADVAE